MWPYPVIFVANFQPLLLFISSETLSPNLNVSYDFLESKVVFSTSYGVLDFPLLNVGFTDFITSFFESSNIIWSLIFPD